MREILFKAKRIDNGEWVEGGYSYCKKDDTHFITQMSKDHISYIGRHQQVDADTICQYTGLTDKNGSKIWENDVVVYDNSPYNVYCKPHTGQIIHIHGCLCYRFLLYGSVTYKSFLSDDFFEMKSEVIGNIFDNPELVGGAV